MTRLRSASSRFHLNLIHSSERQPDGEAGWGLRLEKKLFSGLRVALGTPSLGGYYTACMIPPDSSVHTVPLLELVQLGGRRFAAPMAGRLFVEYLKSQLFPSLSSVDVLAGGAHSSSILGLHPHRSTSLPNAVQPAPLQVVHSLGF